MDFRPTLLTKPETIKCHWENRHLDDCISHKKKLQIINIKRILNKYKEFCLGHGQPKKELNTLLSVLWWEKCDITDFTTTLERVRNIPGL